MRYIASLFALILFTFSVSADGTRPALWKVSDDDTTIHVFGTVHVLKPGTIWLDDEFQTIVSGADTIYLELAPDQQSPQVMQPLVQQLGMLPAGDTLKNYLTDAQYTEISTSLTALGMPEAALNQFKPWLAGITYSAFRFIKQGYTPGAGVEATITGLAQARGTTIKGLETAEFQLAMFDDMSDEQEKLFIEQALDDSVDLPELMDKMTTTWTTGDTEGLDELLNEMEEEAPALAETILFARNRTWVGDIQEILKQPGNYLIAVGAGHLVGDKSVIALLPGAGIKVERLH